MKNLIFLLLIASPLQGNHANLVYDEIVKERNEARKDVERFIGSAEQLAYITGIEVGLSIVVSLLEANDLIKKEPYPNYDPRISPILPKES